MTATISGEDVDDSMRIEMIAAMTRRVRDREKKLPLLAPGNLPKLNANGDRDQSNGE